MRLRRLLDRLLGRRQNLLDIAHEVFLTRCADGDMAARFGRPDVFVSDVRRMAG